MSLSKPTLRNFPPSKQSTWGSYLLGKRPSRQSCRLSTYSGRRSSSCRPELFHFESHRNRNIMTWYIVLRAIIWKLFPRSIDLWPHRTLCPFVLHRLRQSNRNSDSLDSVAVHRLERQFGPHGCVRGEGEGVCDLKFKRCGWRQNRRSLAGHLMWRERCNWRYHVYVLRMGEWLECNEEANFRWQSFACAIY